MKTLQIVEVIMIITLTLILIPMPKYFYNKGYEEGMRDLSKAFFLAAEEHECKVPIDTCTEKTVFEYLNQLKVKHPEIALAQARLESKNFTSRVFKENNNMFGMQMAEKRPTTALGRKGKYAYYSDWRQSVLDYALWQSRFMTLERENKHNWLLFLNRYYSEIGKNYSKRLLGFIQKDTNKG